MVTGRERGNVAQIAEGMEVVVSGWAFVDWGKKPAAVLLVEGERVIAEGREFSMRADVSKAFRRPVEACGWRVRFESAGLGSGEHRVEVKVRRDAGGPARALRQRIVLVVSPRGTQSGGT